MAVQISKNTAQQIADTVKEVCGYDINFIRPDGIILASTDPDRTGEFHEIGARAARTGQTLEVSGNESFPGSRTGVNMPFSYHGETIAVIGITGEPEDVRKYANLARQITYLILREQEFDSAQRDREARTGYVIRSLTEGSRISQPFLSAFLKEHHLPETAPYRTVVICLDGGYAPACHGAAGQKIRQCLSEGGGFYTFLYPDRYIQILPDKLWNVNSRVYRDLAEAFPGYMSIAIGSRETLRRQNISYNNALLALSSAQGSYREYDALDIEILLGSLSEKNAQNYIGKTISALSGKEKHLLREYFSKDMSLKKTAEALFIHKNTLQYNLDKIHTLTGYNPRRFRDAVILYIGLMMEENPPSGR
jgi:carbohydrate diacid regulator